MTLEEYQDLKQYYLEKTKQYLVEEGNVPPHLTLFGNHIAEDKAAIVHIPIPDKFLQDDSAKDAFVDTIIPQLVKEVVKKFQITAVAWVSEAWMRVGSKSDSDKDLMNSPIKKEVLIFSIEGKYGEQLTIYEMKRSGMEVTESGSMIDHIDLVECTEVSSSNPDVSSGDGRFQGLYKKFTEPSSE